MKNKPEKATKNQFIAAIAIGAAYAAVLFSSAYWMWKERFPALPAALWLSLLVALGIVVSCWAVRRFAQQEGVNLVKAAYTDPVTQSDNFAKFKLDTEAMFRLNPTTNYAIFYSDIKNFKYINDVYGFETGNLVLRRYGQLLRDANKLAYARITADNFVSIEKYDNEEDLKRRCNERIANVGDISSIVDGMPAVTIFVGIYCTGGDNTSLSLDAMIDRANIAQRQVKRRQLAGCQIFAEQFRTVMLAEQEMENAMRPALENGEFIVYLQPKVDIHTGKIAAAEALVRWNHPQAGLIPPMNFIPLFERNGFIQQLDTYMFQQVCRLIRKWLDAGKHIIPISVNVSKMQLLNPNFLRDYTEAKERYDIPDGYLEIEFTESLLFDNSAQMTTVLQFFQEHGFLSSIDDFGSGYSSLNLLKNLPVDYLKLDKLFFDVDEFQHRERVIIKNVILMAKELSMQTVAEGVEQWEQVDFLKSVECEMVQGYIFDKPMPVDAFEQKYIVSEENLTA